MNNQGTYDWINLSKYSLKCVNKIYIQIPKIYLSIGKPPSVSTKPELSSEIN